MTPVVASKGCKPASLALCRCSPVKAREKPLNLAEQENALKRLVYCYCHAVDRKKPDLLTDLYTKDGLHEHGGLFSGPVEAFIEWLRPQLSGIQTQHLVGNCLFAIDGDYAEGEIYTVNYHRLQRDGQTVQYDAGGRYRDQYQRVDGQWRIKRRQRLIDWAQEKVIETDSATAAAIGDSEPIELSLLDRQLRGL